MINLTDSAINALKAAISSIAQPASGLRIMVEGGGCQEFTYKMGLAHEPTSDETVFEQGGIRVFVDNESGVHLNGTTIDFVVSLQGSGFRFENPNAKSSCSCGKSFS
ncbi:iron-sulfur cluster assembly accessory protein [Bradyrhizobium canariense]|uniref:Iron-sulfur cluster assembly accessory protein n=1 Tax=Bradyrhizobium canariense TaxID=255045 RepID=A0A1X3GZE9_9BRAD|nr:iron-sulfur cluster assembly accessory protein [Bradyrhizobium canariense]OSI65750.1 iron-sulfur cluster assembly accessory protein [Bradyrhizobium canariense]OSI76199.1 iron-sulfur cluster assembly accessory protein [Bradyrhizobium canariense]OSI87646.1 iron-sulfur cluster assembly accessory protein [Bradyrhizobium canariense]OSI87717.1 iron-sulfur cluster assembly accessory protein [Bradyrhizobium canariense]OSI99703.1 iron-sulfur cluster assembly accessory protein [Bradyrhizobium canarie